MQKDNNEPKEPITKLSQQLDKNPQLRKIMLEAARKAQSISDHQKKG